MNIAIYCRVGNKEQLESLDEQRGQLEKFCKDIGMEVTEVAFVPDTKKEVKKERPPFRL